MLRIFKIVLSVAALVVTAAAAVLASGQPVQVAPETLFLVQSIAGGVGILGLSPIDLPEMWKRGCTFVGGVMSAMVLVHSRNVHPGDNPHPWLWASVGLAAAIIGVMGKSLIPHASAAPAPAGPSNPGPYSAT